MTENNDAGKLEACPFCGGEAIQRESKQSLGSYDEERQCVWIDCTKCGATRPGITVDWSLKPPYVKERAEAITAWNSRPTTPAMLPDEGDVKAVAVAMWIEEARRAAPNVAKYRNATMFREQPDHDISSWKGLARAAIAAMPNRAPTSAAMGAEAVDANTLARAMDPDLFDPDQTKAKRAASPFNVAIARGAAVTSARIILDRLRPLYTLLATPNSGAVHDASLSASPEELIAQARPLDLSANSGADEGVTLADHALLDLLIVDCKMPHGEPYESRAIELIRRHRLTSANPARTEVLEEAAKLADAAWESMASQGSISPDREFVGAAQVAREIAAAIRALQTKGG